jgi:hypothetical protein
MNIDKNLHLVALSFGGHLVVIWWRRTAKPEQTIDKLVFRVEPFSLMYGSIKISKISSSEYATAPGIAQPF